jgi:alanyl-tRNA synthetase
MYAFERDPYLTRLETEVLSTGEEGGRPFVLLADTICYPEGGGQPADHGVLRGTRILDVQKRDGTIRHYLSNSTPLGGIELELDWTRRFDHMQQHTGQHLLTALAQDRLGWATTAFHLGERVCDVELDAPRPSRGDLEALEEWVAGAIREARPVNAWRVGPEEYATLPVRSRGLPEGHVGDIRLVQIGDLDLNTCGGTHVRHTSELEALKLLGCEPIRGGTRLFFVAGGRVRHRLEAHERRNAALRALLGAPDPDLVTTLEARLEQLKLAERRIRHLEEELATALVEALTGRPGTLVEHHFEGRDAAFLQKAARQLVSSGPSRTVFLTATLEGQSSFVLAAGEAAALDVATLGKDIAALLEGRGGGSKGFFQGRAGSLVARPAVLVRLEDACASH